MCVFKKIALGEKMLVGILKKMCSDAGIMEKKQISVIKTMCTNLLHSGVAPNIIQQLSRVKDQMVRLTSKWGFMLHNMAVQKPAPTATHFTLTADSEAEPECY